MEHDSAGCVQSPHEPFPTEEWRIPVLPAPDDVETLGRDAGGVFVAVDGVVVLWCLAGGEFSRAEDVDPGLWRVVYLGGGQNVFSSVNIQIARLIKDE